MKTSLFLLSFFLLINLHLTHSQIVDFSRKTVKRNNLIVNNVIEQILASGVFPDDRLFMRRSASIQPPTLWGVSPKISNEMFEITKNDFQVKYPQLYDKVEKHFGIKWSEVTYEDLEKPLYEGVAGRILVHLSDPEIPASMTDQAKIYKKIFKEDTTNSFFNPDNNYSPKQCTDYVDIAFLIDGSNLESDNSKFSAFSELAKKVANELSINNGEVDSDSRSSIVQFSDGVTRVTKMGDYRPIHEIKLTFDNKNARNTDKALEYLLNEELFADQEERLKPRVALLMTTGKSSNPEKTKEQLKIVLDAGISVIIVTVGEPFEAVDMNAPILFRNIVWKDYSDANHAEAELFQVICNAPVVIKPDNKTMKRAIYHSQNVNCLIDSSNPITNVEFSADENAKTTLFISPSPAIFPSPVYNEKIVIVKNQNTELISFSKKEGFDMVPCSFQSEKNYSGYDLMRVVILSSKEAKSETGPLKNQKREKPRVCKSNLCKNGGDCIEKADSTRCQCTDKYTGEHCETEIESSSATGVHGSVYPAALVLIRVIMRTML